MVAIIKIVNTMCFIYILTNPKMRTLLLNTIYVAYSFLLKEIDDGFKRQDEFIHHLVTGLFKNRNGEVNTNTVTDTNTNTITDEKPEEKEKEKVEEKFEDKYLQRFKTFKNEYSFTETELELEKQKYDELKKTFVDDKNKLIEEINNKINKIKRIISCVVFDENGDLLDVTKDGIQRLIKYFNIEYEYNEDPESYVLSDLFSELSEILKESQQKIKEEEEKNVLDDDFKQQAYQYMLNKKLDGYMNNYVNDMTPLGNVYMRYNNSKKSFEYYSNNTIPYRYLEPVGRKFVLTYFCKPLFIDIEDELNKSKLKKEEHDTKEANKKKEQSEKSEQPNDKKNVFAKLKSYNSTNNQSSNSSEMMKMEKRNVLPPQMKANLPNVNNAATPEDMLLKENANRYTWEGRLSNMSLLKKVDRKVVDKKYAMTFADFKRLQKQ
jgi:hypothetical protein